VAKKLDVAVPEEKRRGRSTKYWAMQVNNNPMYGINPRFNGMALAYAVGRRSDLIQDYDAYQAEVLVAPVYPNWSDEDKKKATEHAYHTAEKLTGKKDAADPNSYNGKAEIVSEIGIVTGITDLVGTCKWHTEWLYLDLVPDHFARAMAAGLGREISGQDLVDASLRLRNMERAYEAMHGRTREQDTVPEKEFDNPVSRGPWKGLILEREKFEWMKDQYYELRGWDLKTGIPTKKTLEDSGLQDVAQDLKEKGILPE
jgi:aldehyde:ferredoxin oxidoreductase